MSAEVKARRRYNSEGRRRRADEKRREILVAARELFLERGYRATTMEGIAQRAATALETVYAGFGNKSKLFARVLDVAIVGDERDLALMERGWVAEVQAEPDPRARLRRIIAVTGEVLSRVGPLHALAVVAMDGDADLASLKQRQDELRYRTQLEFMRFLQDGLRQDLTLEAARDIYWAVASPEVQQLLTVDRQWSRTRYQEWLMSVLEPALLGPSELGPV